MQSLVKNISQHHLIHSIVRYATQMFCLESDFALSSSCYEADFILGGLASGLVHN